MTQDKSSWNCPHFTPGLSCQGADRGACQAGDSWDSPVIHARYPGPQGHAQSWEHSIPKRLLAALPQTTAPKYPHGTFPLSLDFFISLLAVARCHGLSSPQGAAQALCFPAHFHICSCESLQDAGLSSPVAVALRNYWRWIMP